VTLSNGRAIEERVKPDPFSHLGRNLESSELAGAPGFEPGNGGIKIRCLTTWLRPIDAQIERAGR
jgi:hypothetical protein